MKAILERANIPGDALDLVIFGNILRAGHGQLIPRQAAIKGVDVDCVAIIPSLYGQGDVEHILGRQLRGLGCDRDGWIVGNKAGLHEFDQVGAQRGRWV